MTNRNLTTLLTVLLVIISAGTVSISAQTGADTEKEPEKQEAPASSGFIERVGVVRVNLQVFVTDKKNNPIRGLTADDFEVFEDGRKVEVTNFQEVVEGRRPGLDELVANAPDEVQIDTTLELEPIQGDMPPPPPEDERLHLVIYVDNFNLRPNHRVWALDGVKEFLRNNLGPHDQAMVVSYDRSFKVRQEFTNDRFALIRGLQAAGEDSTFLNQRDAERRRVLEDIQMSRDTFNALSHVREYAQFVEHQMGFTIRAAEEMVQMLAGIRGRKALLYVSDGIPMVAGEDLFMAIDVKYGAGTAHGQAFRHDLSRHYKRLAVQANSNGVKFYTLDAKGNSPDMSFTADERRDRYGYKAIWIEQTFQANMSAPLQMLAESTGGKAIVGTNAIVPALDRVGQDFRNYYSLAYKPLVSSSGRYHSIDVRIKGKKKLRVRHRSGHQPKSEQRQLVEGTTATLFFGFEQNPLHAQIEFGEPRFNNDNRMMLPVLVRIPIEHVLLVPRADEHLARMQVTVGVMDSEGQLSPVENQQPFEFVVADDQLEQAREKFYTYEVNLLMRRGRQRVGVALHDSHGGKTSYIHRTVEL